MATIKGRALSDVRVTKISLVDRAATRQPFKIIKRDQSLMQKAETKPMNFSLKSLFKSAAAPAPKTVAIVAAKSADQAKVVTRMKNAGFEHEAGVEVDGQIVYARKGEKIDLEAVVKDDGVIIKSDDNVAVVVANVRKGLLSAEVAGPTSFAERLASNCVIPGLDNAMGALNGTVWDALYGAGDPSEAVSKIDAAFTEASAYVKTLVGAIPTEAFKMEAFKAEGGVITFQIDGDQGVIRFPMEASGKDPSSGAKSMGSNGGSKGVDPTGGSDIDGDDDQAVTIHKGGKKKPAAADADDMADGGADDCAEVKKGSTGTTGGDTGMVPNNRKSTDGEIDGEAASVDTVSKKDFTEFLTKFDAFTKSIKKDIGSLVGDIDDLQERVQKTEVVAGNAAKKLKTTVAKTALVGDREPVEGKTDYEGGLIDTARDRHLQQVD